MRHVLDDYRTANNSKIDISFDSDYHSYYVTVHLVDKEPFEVVFSDLNEANKFAFAFIRAYNEAFMRICF